MSSITGREEYSAGGAALLTYFIEYCKGPRGTYSEKIAFYKEPVVAHCMET